MGGIKDSGLGRRHGRDGILKYTEPQTVAVQRLHGFGPPPSVSWDTWAKGFTVSLRVAQGARPPMTRGARDRLRRRRRGLRVRRLGDGAAAGREGLPGLVLEAGRRFADDEFARTSWDLRRWLWAPRLGCYGIQRIHRLPDVTVLAGAGVGGGSLVYANTLYRPDDAFYDDPQWRDVADWRAELAPTTTLAERMLGVTHNPTTRRPTWRCRQVAEEMGVGHTFALTPVGVFFGDGAGRDRRRPVLRRRRPGPHRLHPVRRVHDRLPARREEHAGQELPLPRRAARRRGAPADDRDRAACGARRGLAGRDRAHRRVAAAAHPRARSPPRRSSSRPAPTAPSGCCTGCATTGRLPRLSPRLGELTRTNSESLLGALSAARATSTSPAASRSRRRSTRRRTPTSSRCATAAARTRWACSRPCLTDGDGPRPRLAAPGCATSCAHPRRFAAHARRSAAGRSAPIIALVMQSLDNSLIVSGRAAGSAAGG